MMTPVETQPTVSYSVSMSLPGTSSAEGASEARSAGPSVVAADTNEEKAPAGGLVGHQQLPIAGAHHYQPASGPMQPQFQLQSQAPPQFQQQSQAPLQFQQQSQAPPQFQLQSQVTPQFQLQSQTQPQFQMQSQAPPAYTATVQQQQQQQQPLMTSDSAIYPWDQQVILQAPGFAATNAGAQAVAAASADMIAWMPKPIVTTLCPPGLEYFAELSQLMFMEEMPTNLTEISNMGIANRRLSVRDAQGQQIYVADTMHYDEALGLVQGFVDRTGQVLMTVTMKGSVCPNCCAGMCCNGLLEGIVEAPQGIIVGTVEQESSGGYVSFVIKNTEGSPVLYLEGPKSVCVCGNGEWQPNIPYRPFTIFSLDRQHELGNIVAIPSGSFLYDGKLLTNVTLAFPADLDVKVKATLAGAATMLHRTFFGIYRRSNRRHRAHRRRRH